MGKYSIHTRNTNSLSRVTFLWVPDCWLVGEDFLDFVPRWKLARVSSYWCFCCYLGFRNIAVHCKTWIVSKFGRKDFKILQARFVGKSWKSRFQERFTEWFSCTQPQIFHVTQVVWQKKMMDMILASKCTRHAPLKIDGWSSYIYILFSYKENGPPFQVTLLHFRGGVVIIKNQRIQLQFLELGRVDPLKPCKRWA